MKYLHIPVFILFFVLLPACNTNKQSASKAIPTEEENAQAIKDALKQGVDKAIATLSATDGFLSNDSLKISLPSEAQAILNNIRKIPQGNLMVENVLSRLNKAAEGSVKTIGPIINATIDSMSVEEANKLLFANNAAATAYLQKIAYKPLHIACEPVIVASLDKTIVSNITTREAWNTLAGNYNKIAGSGVGKIADLPTVDDDMVDDYVTAKVLDAVFYLIAKEEMNIRKHPATRISQSIVRSFGQID